MFVLLKRFVLEIVIDFKDKKKDMKKDVKKDVNKFKYFDGRLKKNKFGVEGVCDVFLSIFDCLKWFRVMVKFLVFIVEFYF